MFPVYVFFHVGTSTWDVAAYWSGIGSAPAGVHGFESNFSQIMANFQAPGQVCHLGWYCAVGWPLTGGRGSVSKKKKKTSCPQQITSVKKQTCTFVIFSLQLFFLRKNCLFATCKCTYSRSFSENNFLNLPNNN